MATNKIYIPSKNHLQKDDLDYDSVLHKLRLASNLIPVRLKKLRDTETEATVLRSLEGSNICLEGFFKNRYLGACLAYIDRGSVISSHFHNNHAAGCYEIVYGLAGCAIVRMKNKNGELENYEIHHKDLLVIPPGEPHSVECIETGVLLCVTIPADPDYPDANEQFEG